MRLNESTILVGQDIFLVPYRSEHVERYHEWMKDPAIREATASEPLSLEEEYDMQRSWHLDEDKLTFILLARKDGEDRPASLTINMIGDVNVFFSPVEEDEEHDGSVQHIAFEDSLVKPDATSALQAELEIMIAEPSVRRQGLASQALQLMLQYVSIPPLSIPPKHFLVRIGQSNKGSIAMFEKLGFEIVKTVEVFQEVEMRMTLEAQESLSKQAEGAGPSLSIAHCPLTDGDR